MPLPRLIIIAFLLFFGRTSVTAQQHFFIQYSIQEGLAQTQVFDIAQDDKGFIWVATVGGVSRFDGIEFQNYSTRDGLLKNQARVLEFGQDGKLWIGTDGGYSVYDGINFRAFALDSIYQDAELNDILVLDSETALIATDAYGVLKVRNGRVIRTIDHTSGIGSPTVRALVAKEDGTILMGTRAGLYSLDQELFAADVHANPDLGSANISNLMIDHEGVVWVSSFGQGVYGVKEEKVVHYTEDDGLILNWVREVVRGPEGVWMASRSGLSELLQGEISNYTVNNGLPYQNLRCLLVDREGNIWIGTDGKGLLKFTGKAFETFTRSDGMAGDLVLAVEESKRGTLFFGTLQEGIVQLRNGIFSAISIQDGLPNNTVWSLEMDRKGRLWAGTSMGLACVDGKEVRSFVADSTSPVNLPDYRITAVFEDRDGSIWVGHRSGVSTIDPRSLATINYGLNEGFRGTHIRNIVQDADGMIWFAAENGLHRFDGERFTYYPINDRTNQGTKVYSLKLDERGTLWIGTENGLFYTDDKGSSFKDISLGTDSRADFINFLLIDEVQHLWVGTNYGIFELELDDFYKNEPVSPKSHTYHEGIPNLECNLNAAYQDRNGNYWFGTGGGLLRLNARFRENLNMQPPPELILYDIRLFQEKTDWKEYTTKTDPITGLPRELQLKHNKNHLTFSFIGINFSNPDFVRYKYKLDGFDEEWSPVGNNRFATYSNLPPGEYTFKVLAMNSAGIWTETPLTFSFEILPPYWTTWWFYSLIVIGFLLLSFGIFRWRLNVLKQRQERLQLVYQSRLLELEQQSLNASMNRHFIFNALNSIQYYINRQDKVAANRYLTSFAKLIRKNLDSSTENNTVSLSEELERLSLYLKLEHMRFSEKFEYNIDLDESIDLEQVEVPAMLLQPFVENSIWHGILPMKDTGIIRLKVDEKDNDIVIEITDNGIGIDESRKQKASSQNTHSSKGMKITSGRVELLRKMSRKNIILEGPFELKNKDGEANGTIVRIRISNDFA